MRIKKTSGAEVHARTRLAQFRLRDVGVASEGDAISLIVSHQIPLPWPMDDGGDAADTFLRISRTCHARYADIEVLAAS